MANMIGKAVAACGLAGALLITVAAPSLAQIVVVGPGYGGSGVYAGPYGAYAYSPGYRYGYRSWDDYPAGYDSSGAPYSYRDLGWQPTSDREELIRLGIHEPLDHLFR